MKDFDVANRFNSQIDMTFSSNLVEEVVKKDKSMSKRKKALKVKQRINDAISQSFNVLNSYCFH